MVLIEGILLICTYSLLILSFFLQIVCYKRNLEPLETIVLTASLLFLIVVFSASYFSHHFAGPTDSVSAVQLVAIILVGLTTLLNTLQERVHTISNQWKTMAVSIAVLLFIATCVGANQSWLIYVAYVVIAFLAITVLTAMVLIRTTPPQKRLAHKEKIERSMASVFLIVIPLTLLLELYFFRDQQFTVGIILPIAFIILAGGKIWDDLTRLSLFKTPPEAKAQQFKNYALTAREQEIALLLTKGMTYKQIAEDLFISVPTVKTHVSNLYRKCSVKNKHELINLLVN